MPGPSNLPPGVTDRMIEEQAGAFQNHDLHDVQQAASNAALINGWDGSHYPPGKYEGEPYEAPYWYEVTVLDGCGEVHGDANCIQIFETEREAFKIDKEMEIVAVSERDDGFVHIQYLTQEEYNEFQEFADSGAAYDNNVEHDGQPDEAKEWEDFDPDC